MFNCHAQPLLRRVFFAAALALAPLGCARAETVTVFAAASLKAALDDVVAGFENTFDYKVQTAYAGSSTLARQIERGAPANAFLSANIGWMDQLDTQGLLEPETRVALLTNELVLIAPTDAAIAPMPIAEVSFAPLLENTPLAMGFVDAVPSGIYGKAALSHLGFWGVLSKNVAQTDSVRSALALVARAEARLGIVYATDAQAEPRVSVVATFPNDSHDPIVYPAAVIAPATQGARDFATYLTSPEAQAIFGAHGFGSAAP